MFSFIYKGKKPLSISTSFTYSRTNYKLSTIAGGYNIGCDKDMAAVVVNLDKDSCRALFLMTLI